MIAKIVTAITMGGIRMDKIDFVFAYLLAFINVLALNFIPDWNSKILYLVASTAIVFVVAYACSWIEDFEREVKA